MIIVRYAATMERYKLYQMMTESLYGSVQIVENRNQDKMNVARRTCGYIGTQFWNQGRTQEIKERVLHL